ncbi:DUF2207 domain-containing protein [Rossellomorea vietnamensis]|uniref:DUF2207 domain-containing protein n=1 Tax=Rossellomorea vietnamensis TaxID=218284 RepID=UPI0016539D24|nr:DUF2207 domain-containing protein [Rossellomorea vietnamensis]
MKIRTIILALVLCLFLIPAQVSAVDFTIEHTQIDAFLKEDGNVQVTEQHTYQFDGDFNGITRTLIPKENTRIENVEAVENNKPLEVKQEGNLYKIFRGGSDETITIDLSYTIKNGVEVYTDLGQFYWPFFDSSNESSYENMDIYVHPPQPTGEVLALGYGEAAGTIQTTKDGVVHFELGEVESGENGDIRAAYDASMFPGASINEGKAISSDLTAEIAAQEEKLAAFENRKDFLSLIAPFIVGAFAIYLSALLITAWRKKRAVIWDVERNSLQQSLLPKEEMSLPATILHMKSMIPSGSLLSAALLDLVRKGIVDRRSENEFILGNRSSDHRHEEMLIQWLFYKIGNEGKFSIDTLDNYIENKENQQSYHEDFTKWVEEVKAEIKEHRLVQKKVGLRWTVAISGLLLLPFTILFGVHDLLMWMFFSLLLSILFILFAMLYQPRTIMGARIKHQWNHLSSTYTNVDKKQWSEWMSDEQMRAFIYAIGINDKAMLKKNENLASTNADSGFGYTSSDIVMLMIIASTLTNSFNQAEETVSAGTGTGSVPGGGSGVGGGGGGSGAF